MNKQPIGIFDSGIGGTSIWREITSLLPYEDTIYLSDSKNAPYGEKPKEDILHFSIKNVELLIEKKCKLIVVACNTATTNTIKQLRANYDIPFIGIEPAIKPAALQSKTLNIGILATKGTLSSSLFSESLERFTESVTVIEQIGSGIVDLIENGQLESPEMTFLLEKYLQPMLSKNIDVLVLGCTHYPYLIPQIKKITKGKVKIIDSGLAVAKQTKAILEKYNLTSNNLDRDSEHKFFINSASETLKQLLGSFCCNKNYSVNELNF